MRIETLAVHGGREVDPATGAVAPAIHLSTSFERGPDGEYSRGYIYTRDRNPNRDALESALAALEGGEAAAAFASGMAAIAAVFQALRPGDHVLAPDDAYHGTLVLLRDLLPEWQLAADFVDMSDPAAVRAALRPNTRLVWVETPSNPLLKITDVARIAELAREAGALCVCDNTFATPILQRPLELGADFVVHSTTKYLGGHSDAQGGAVVARRTDSFFERIRAVQKYWGGVPSPFNCWLTLRSLPTLPLRVRTQSENAARIARFLAEHPAVSAVYYPGLPQHPGHEIAARQMAMFGAMISVRIRGGRDAAMAVAGRVRLFTRATSLGGVESLIEHRASIEGPRTRTPDDLLRLSIGIEHVDDLLEDLERALAG